MNILIKNKYNIMMFSNKKLWLENLRGYNVFTYDHFYIESSFKFNGEFKNDFPVYEYTYDYNDNIYDDDKTIYYVEDGNWYNTDDFFKNKFFLFKIDINKKFLVPSIKDSLIPVFNRNIYNYILNNVYYSIDYHEKTYNKFIINLILTFKKFNLPISALAEPGKPLGFPIELIWNILSFLKLKDLII